MTIPTVRLRTRRVGLFRPAAVSRVMLLATATTASVFAIRTNEDVPLVLFIAAFVVMVIGPFLVGFWDGMPAVLVTTLLAMVGIVIASRYGGQSDWGACVHAQGMDGNSPMPCRGDLRAGFGLVPATWIIVTSVLGARLRRADIRADERKAQRRADGPGLTP